MQIGVTNYIYKNELNKACFAQDVAFSDSKDLTKRTAADKNLRNNAFEISNNLKHNGYERTMNFSIEKQKEMVLKMKSNKINN